MSFKVRWHLRLHPLLFLKIPWCWGEHVAMTNLGKPAEKKGRNDHFYFTHRALIERQVGECGPRRKNPLWAASIFHPFWGGHQTDKLVTALKSWVGRKRKALSNVNLSQRPAGATCQGILILDKLLLDINLKALQCDTRLHHLFKETNRHPNQVGSFSFSVLSLVWSSQDCDLYFS